MRQSIVICISGPSGAGKSSLMERSVELLEDAVSFYFDAYQSTLRFPDDLFERINRGEKVAPHEVRNDEFLRDLTQLHNGMEVTDPWNRKLMPAKFIIVEEPFGRLREGMDAIIHTSVCIDLPLEISLCRRMIRNLTYDYVNEPPQERLDRILNYVTSYHDFEGKAMRHLYEHLKLRSDLLLDGLKSKETIVQQLLEHLKEIKRRQQ